MKLKKIYLWPAALAVIFMSSVIIILSPVSQKTLVPVPAPTITPTPTPIPWLIYRNEEYGFEFKAPYADIQETKLSYTQIIKNYNSVKYPKYCPTEAIDGERFCEVFDLVYEKEYAVEGVKIYYFINQANDGETGKLYFSYKNKKYLVNLGLDTKQIISRILSTFKFLPDTSTWKTYNNDKYGFTLKHPNNWQLSDFGIYVSISNGGERYTSSSSTYLLPGQVIFKVMSMYQDSDFVLGKHSYKDGADNSYISDCLYISPNKSYAIFIDYSDTDPSSLDSISLGYKIFSTFKSTVDNMLDWETFTNEKYQFEFKIPPNYKAEPYYEENITGDRINIFPQNEVSGYILSIKKNSFSNLKDYYQSKRKACDQSPGCEMYSPFNNSGKLGEKVITSDFPNIKSVLVERDFHWSETMTVAIWNHNDFVYELYFGDGGNFEIFSKILSTFKFTQ